MSYHGAFSLTQICPDGLTPGSPSSVPARMVMRPGGCSKYLKSGEPQPEQKCRRLPGELSWKETCSSPATSEKCSRRTKMLVFREDPVALRHSSQWQYIMATGASEISYRTLPQRQCPVSIQVSFAAGLSPGEDPDGRSPTFIRKIRPLARRQQWFRIGRHAERPGQTVERILDRGRIEHV